MSREDLIAAAKAPVEAFNAKDWDRVRNVVSSGFVYDEVATRRRIEGVEEVLEVWRGWAEAFPDSEATFENTYVDGDDVILEITWRGTHTGVLRAPNGEIAATGKKIDLPACQFLHIENGQAASARHFFDMLSMLSQLGVAPGAGVASAAS